MKVLGPDAIYILTYTIWFNSNLHKYFFLSLCKTVIICKTFHLINIKCGKSSKPSSV